MLLEWSAPPEAELTDRTAWRMASPHWSAEREGLIAQRLAGAESGESDDVDEPDPLMSIRCQWLNQWPAKRLKLNKGEPLVDIEDWLELRGEVHDDRERIWIAVEDHSGFGCAIAVVCKQLDGRYGLDAWLVDSWAEGMADIRTLMDGHDIPKLLVGASLVVRLPPGVARGAQAITSSATRATLPAMREMISAGTIVHDSPELEAQMDTVRVVEAIGGLGVVPGIRSDLVRAASWALAAAARPHRQVSIH